MISIGKSIDNYSKKISFKLFNKNTSLLWAIFNQFIHKLIIKKNKNDNRLNNFLRDGFLKLDEKFLEEVNFINNQRIIDKKDIGRQFYVLGEEDKNRLISSLERKLKPLFCDLKETYKSEVYLGDVRIWRNFNIDGIKKEKNIYSEDFHTDGYLCTYLKIHVNLMDVKHEDGPLNIIKKNFTQNFIDDFKYKNRREYKDINPKEVEYLIVNTGKKGDAILFDSSNCYHRATIPNNFRDMMQLTILIHPKKLEKFYVGDKFLRFNTKPNFINTLLLMYKHLIYKFYKI